MTVTIGLRNPIRDMITLRETMDQMFNDVYTRNRDYRSQPAAWQLPVDAYATDDAIVLVADVPGLKPEDLDVTLEGDTLTIRGEIKPRPAEPELPAARTCHRAV